MSKGASSTTCMYICVCLCARFLNYGLAIPYARNFSSIIPLRTSVKLSSLLDLEFRDLVYFSLPGVASM